MPLILALQFSAINVVNTEGNWSEAGLKGDWGINVAQLAINLFAPAGIQVMLLTNKLYRYGFDLVTGELIPKKLRFDADRILPRVR